MTTHGPKRSAGTHRLEVKSASGINALRTSFFASAGHSAARFGLRFEDVLTHLWEARQLTGPIDLGRVVYIDDLTHVAACVRGIDRAWSDLVEHYECWLTRRIRPECGQIDALLDVRRLFKILRSNDRRPALRQLHQLNDLPSDTLSDIPLSLSVYRGYVPLKVWLANALIASCGHVVQPTRAFEITGRLTAPGNVGPVR